MDILRDERKRERGWVSNFVRGIRDEDIALVIHSAEELRDSSHGQFRAALKKAALIPRISHRFRHQMLDFHLQYGDSLRTASRHDFVLLDFYRAVLPRYKGKRRVLYRGCSLSERRWRTYGWSWTSRRTVAQMYAETGFCRAASGGSVLLKTNALAEAIVCAPALINDRYGESEFILDRRRLEHVEVIQQFPQRTCVEVIALAKRGAGLE